MSERGRAFIRGLSLVFIDPPRIRECEDPLGPTRNLSEWRTELAERRMDIVGKPGLYLDRSQTGTGKTTADIEAVRRANRALIITPTHENCAEIEKSMLAAGIDAIKYPARSTEETEKKTKNCWNGLADVCERVGLSVITAVCPSCSQREECLRCGYLEELARVKSAAVAIATHPRAIYNKLDRLADGRGELIAIHEDAANTVCPRVKVTEDDLQAAADILSRVLNDPARLDWLGQAASRDEDGVLTPDPKLAERRNRLDDFVRRLADLIDDLLHQLGTAARTQEVQLPPPVTKAVGIENLLLRASLEMNVQFVESPWRLLLAALTGELFSLGVILDERKSDGTKVCPDPA